ncbi:putative heavy metal-associated domain, HMA, heavy metal-associated domain superfamily [Helianthus annuus]|nr:putative heavy metal-associated domain, HMA, heavy metal-associated domain superfamily [Helianthus annuus]
MLPSPPWIPTSTTTPPPPPPPPHPHPPGDFISPANSSRFLLSDKALSDQFDPLLKQVPLPAPPPPPPLPEKTHKSDDEKLFKKGDANLPSSPVKTPPRTSSSLSSRSSDQQVVVLKVSLHCRGCERKMRKHISKMEGVTSFNIDFMAKKVTVVGDVTPLGVLTSVSKVKNAKLLTPTTISTPTPPVDSNFSEIKKQLGFVA